VVEPKERTLVHNVFLDIPNCGTLDHVPHGEALYGLVLRNAARAIRASHKCDVAAALLVAATISSFLCLRELEFSV
jgi:hypothetical protein